MTTLRNLTSSVLMPLSVVLFFLLFNQALFAAETKVGVVTFSRGTVAALHDGYKPRVLGKGATIYQGDNIQTSERSFAVITFKDKSKITVRPNSNFSVTLFNLPAEKARFNLYEGGVRASSGQIARKSPESFQIITPDTTVNAQQADFSVRVCKLNCQTQEDKLKKTPAPVKKDVIARVVKVRGLVLATNAKITSEDERILTVGAPLYSADVITSKEDSYAVLVFKDKGRITVETETVFAIKEYQFDEAKEDNRSWFDLVLGSVRVLTGRIGKKRTAQYKINTPVATIGIRGTGFDLVVDDDNGLYSQVWQGTITKKNDAGSSDLSVPDADYMKNNRSFPEPLGALSEPQFAALSKSRGKKPAQDKKPPPPAPRPDREEVKNEKELFSSQKLDKTKPGTYVDVHKGHVRVKQKDKTPIDLGKRESSYSDGKGKSVRTKQPPEIMKQDPYPLPSDKFNEATAGIKEFSLLADKSDGENYLCQCK